MYIANNHELCSVKDILNKKNPFALAILNYENVLYSRVKPTLSDIFNKLCRLRQRIHTFVRI